MSAFKYNRLDKANCAVLLVDHQTGLANLVHDFSPDDFKSNVLALADSAKYFKLPTILTTSFEDGPNGPLVPELKELFPHAPYIARPERAAFDLVPSPSSQKFLTRVDFERFSPS